MWCALNTRNYIWNSHGEYSLLANRTASQRTNRSRHHEKWTSQIVQMLQPIMKHQLYSISVQQLSSNLRGCMGMNTSTGQMKCWQNTNSQPQMRKHPSVSVSQWLQREDEKDGGCRCGNTWKTFLQKKTKSKNWICKHQCRKIDPSRSYLYTHPLPHNSHASKTPPMIS